MERIREDEIWFYNNTLLDSVDNFNYLGVVFNYIGPFQLHNQYAIGKAVKAQNVLLLNINKYDALLPFLFSFLMHLWLQH